MKTMKFFLVLLYCSLFASLAKADFNLESPKALEVPKLLSIEQAFQLDFEQKENQLFLHWRVAPKHYMYQGKFEWEAVGTQVVASELPEGERYLDDYLGEQTIYRQDFTIALTLNKIEEGASLTIKYMGCAEKVLCYPPSQIQIPLDFKPTGGNPSEAQVNQSNFIKEQLSSQNLWLALVLCFALGVGLAFTPCVFPMYPILSSFLIQNNQNTPRKGWIIALAYVQGMALTYAGLGLLVGMAGLKYQAAFQNPWLLSFLSGLFVVFALAMFDAFNLQMPSSWTQKINQWSNASSGRGLLGIFCAGALSGLVASPCTTAPLSGILLYIAQSGDAALGFFSLYCLSLGMGLPLLIMGSSSQSWLPKAGAWMNTVKKTFGFLLLAVAIVFVARIAPDVVISILWGLWLLSLISFWWFINQSTQSSIWKQARYTAILILGFGIGWSFKDQWAYSWQSYKNAEASQSTISRVTQHGFIVARNLEELDALLMQAKIEGKPALVDMYAQWCVACKEFETITFQDQTVKELFRAFVLIKVDVTKMDPDNVAILEKYDIRGLPTLLLFNQFGNPQENLRVTGFLSPKDFSARLDQLL
jgi:thiol:disulfide interchange protein DsbD